MCFLECSIMSLGLFTHKVQRFLSYLVGSWCGLVAYSFQTSLFSLQAYCVPPAPSSYLQNESWVTFGNSQKAVTCHSLNRFALDIFPQLLAAEIACTEGMVRTWVPGGWIPSWLSAHPCLWTTEGGDGGSLSNWMNLSSLGGSWWIILLPKHAAPWGGITVPVDT